MIFSSVSQCKSSSKSFQQGEGPSRGLLRDCTTFIFAKVRFQPYPKVVCGAAPAELPRVARLAPHQEAAPHLQAEDAPAHTRQAETSSGLAKIFVSEAKNI